MPAAMLTASQAAVLVAPRTSTIARSGLPGALQQFLHRIEEERKVNPRAAEELSSLRADVESRWRIAGSEGQTSTMLYEILEYGWNEWRRITAQENACNMLRNNPGLPSAPGPR